MGGNTGKASPDEGKVVIFTDLDGTLLDYYTYSCEVVKPLVAKLEEAGVEVVPCSSKTRAEIEEYRSRLGLETPFIVENGGAVFIGRDYFEFPYEYNKEIGDYRVIELGMGYDEVRRILGEVRRKYRLPLRGFGDMSDAEVAELTGLDLVSAGRARQREYGETLNLADLEGDIKYILDRIKGAGLNWSRGSRLYSADGGSDKGVAVRVLADLYRQKWGDIRTIGVGDSPNDEPMLAEVDLPVLVQKPGGYWEEMDIPNLYYAEGIGPDGWVKAIRDITGIS